jgi:SAM-dependent methyltransferase
MRRFVGEARWDIGGDDFRNNGRHFAEKLRDAGLHGASHVLDIGSGCGRIAIPLTGIIDSTGSYTGLELSAPLVAWCSSHITPKHPQFRFVQCDLCNPLYNPTGRADPLAYRFPFDDAAFDLVVATSVFTHLLPEIAVHYFQECARVLQPAGRLFATFYFIDSAIQSVASSLSFEHPWGRHARVANPDRPEEAIGYELDWVLQSAAVTGLEVESPVRWGTWSGRQDGYSGQDVVIFRRRA